MWSKPSSIDFAQEECSLTPAFELFLSNQGTKLINNKNPIIAIPDSIPTRNFPENEGDEKIVGTKSGKSKSVDEPTKASNALSLFKSLGAIISGAYLYSSFK